MAKYIITMPKCYKESLENDTFGSHKWDWIFRKLCKIAEPYDWTPCSESLPKTPGFYFVTYKDDDDRGNEFTDVTEGFWTGREWVKDFLKKLDVIAWMPKMKPYKETDE